MKALTKMLDICLVVQLFTVVCRQVLAASQAIDLQPQIFNPGVARANGCGFPGTYLNSKVFLQLPVITPANVQMVPAVVPVGTIASYSCEEPYIILGETRRTCQPDFSWSGLSPFCGLNIAMHKPLLLPENDRNAFLTNDGIISTRAKDCYSHSLNAGETLTWKLDLTENFQVHSVRILALADFPWSANVTLQTAVQSELPMDVSCGKIEYTGADQTAAVSLPCRKIVPVRWVQIDLSLGGSGRLRMCEINVLAIDALTSEFCPHEASAKAVMHKSCLSFHSHGRSTWGAALQTCRKLGGTLIQDIDGEEQFFLQSKLNYLHRFQQTDAFYWIGLFRSVNATSMEDKWLWTHGQKPTVSFWAPHQPDNVGSRQYCTGMSGRSGWLWNDLNCESGQGFWICRTNFTSCPIPEQPANGLITVLDRRLGGLVNYRCEDGFEMSGVVSRSCLSSGTWSGTLPRCRAPGSSPLPLITSTAQPTTPHIPSRSSPQFSVSTLAHASHDYITTNSNSISLVPVPSNTQPLPTATTTQSSSSSATISVTPPLPFTSPTSPAADGTSTRTTDRTSLESSKITMLNDGIPVTSLKVTEFSPVTVRSATSSRTNLPEGPQSSPSTSIQTTSRNDQTTSTTTEASFPTLMVSSPNSLPGTFFSATQVDQAAHVPVLMTTTARVVETTRLVESVTQPSATTVKITIAPATPKPTRAARTTATSTSKSLPLALAGMGSRCQQVPMLFNGHYSIDMLGPTVVARYSCNQGFNLVGVPFLTCTPDGFWRGIMPLCIPGYGPPQSTSTRLPAWLLFSTTMPTVLPVPSSSLVTTIKTTEFPTTAEISMAQTSGTAANFPSPFSVDSGATPLLQVTPLPEAFITSPGKSGPSVFTTEMRTSGSSVYPRSTVDGRQQNNDGLPNMRCPPLPLVEYAETLFHRNSVLFRCLPGYIMHGSNATRCLPEGVWEPLPECHIVDCGQPEKVNFGLAVLVNYSSTYGSLAAYTCNGQNPSQAPYFRICGETGRWEGPVPDCVVDMQPLVPAESRQEAHNGAAPAFMTIIFGVVGTVGVLLVVLAAVLSIRWARRRENIPIAISPTMYSITSEQSPRNLMRERSSALLFNRPHYVPSSASSHSAYESNNSNSDASTQTGRFNSI